MIKYHGAPKAEITHKQEDIKFLLKAIIVLNVITILANTINIFI